MKVNGKPVTLSEFEYMYHKNNQQQVAQQPLDKYVDMFTVYKLKVADAEAAGIDTTAAFLKEFNGYRNELAQPYLLDTVAEEQMAKEIYERMKYNVKASHIMLKLGKTPEENRLAQAKLDSIRTCILNGESFDSLALKYSIDQSVRVNKGSMGYVSVGRFPYEFEDACYTTPEGEISPVFKTNYGYHIVKTFDRRPDAGKVQVKHILKLYPQNATEEQKAEVKLKMDSIYNVLKGGADFDDLARRESQDPGSARKGGELPWFGRGEMVPEFEAVSYELANGEISEPFSTRYGVHVVKKIDNKTLGAYADTRDQILGMMKKDARGKVAYNSKVAQLKQQYKCSINEKTKQHLVKEVVENGLDSTFVAKYADSAEELFSLNGVAHPVSELAALLKGNASLKGEVAGSAIESKIDELVTTKVVELEKQALETTNDDYRNLINEYRDGMLLFEISNRKVWGKASTDIDGLTAYFEANRDKYKWTDPKFKGYLIQTTNDSITQIVKEKLKTLGQDTVMRTLRREYGKFLRIEHLLVAKGENAEVDSEWFGGAKVKPEGKYKDYFTYGGKILSQPEEVADVRGAVIVDYQNFLEEQWIAQLRKTYPITIDKKVLKKVK